jgi:hypothetical protein
MSGLVDIANIPWSVPQRQVTPVCNHRLHVKPIQKKGARLGDKTGWQLLFAGATAGRLRVLRADHKAMDAPVRLVSDSNIGAQSCLLTQSCSHQLAAAAGTLASLAATVTARSTVFIWCSMKAEQKRELPEQHNH